MDYVGHPLMPHFRLLYARLLMQVRLLHAPVGGHAMAAQHIMSPDIRICTVIARQTTCQLMHLSSPAVHRPGCDSDAT